MKWLYIAHIIQLSSNATLHVYVHLASPNHLAVILCDTTSPASNNQFIAGHMNSDQSDVRKSALTYCTLKCAISYLLVHFSNK